MPSAQTLDVCTGVGPGEKWEDRSEFGLRSLGFRLGQLVASPFLYGGGDWGMAEWAWLRLAPWESHWPPVGFTIIIEPFDDRTPTIANPILHFR